MTESSGSYDSELKDFQQATTDIEKDFLDMQQKRNDVYDQESQIKKRIAEQLKTTTRLKRLAQQEGKSSDVVQGVSTNLKNRQRELLNPGSFFVQLFLGKVNSVVLSGPSSRRYLFKQEYEHFKYQRTLWVMGITTLLLFWSANRAIDTIYQLYLVYFYLTLALRESILQVNGSNIKGWWIIHHYLSVLLSVTLVTWPDTIYFRRFRTPFYVYAVFASITQLLQYKYQMNRLYVIKTLGKANAMDVVNSDSVQGVLSRSFLLLLPFIFVGQLMQLYNGGLLLYWGVTDTIKNHSKWDLQTWPEWQLFVVGLEFLTLFVGNFTTTFTIVKKKFKGSKPSPKQNKSN
ncbi:hypothetical protein AKO1_012486 [Acrasis kona]|uniref:Transmembrane protein 120A n=1 Tax=Acrasis kona TaxID=1008807 RepID=A0AAW2YWX2_9EUKA